MENEKKYFLSQDSMLDGDSADFTVPTNAWVNMENARTGSTDAGVIGTVESIGSTTLISSPQPSVTYIAIGTADDVENQRFVTFYYNVNTSNHKIECCYSSTETIYTVLRSQDVTGGLNFTKEPIHSAKISNGILSWVDSTNNEPRKINIESGIKYYHAGFTTNAHVYSMPLNFSEITMIKPPPIFAPSISKIAQSATGNNQYDPLFLNNQIQYDSFQFAFQYTYYDNETTVVGAYSPSSKINDLSYGAFKAPNFIQVTMDSIQFIPNTVKLVRLIARIDDGINQNSTSAVSIKTWDRDITAEAAEIESQNNVNNQIPLTFNFYNNISGETIPTDDVLRPFDNVPIYSETHEVAKNRYFLANNTEGYDTPKQTSLYISTAGLAYPDNVNQDFQYYRWNWSTGNGTTFPIEVANRWGFNGYFVNGTFNNKTGWHFINDAAYYSSTGDGSAAPAIPLINTVVPASSLKFCGRDVFFIVGTVRDIVTAFPRSVFYDNFDVQPVNNGIQGNVTIPATIAVNTFNAYPQLSTYKFGVVFYDYAMRKCGVVPRGVGTGVNNVFSISVHTASVIIRGRTKTYLQFAQNVSTRILIGNTIVISGGSAIDGTYRVDDVGYTVADGAFPDRDVEVFPEPPTMTTYTTVTVTVYGIPASDITTPARNFVYTSATNSIAWSLNNTYATTEIPEWAYYYSVVKTLNLRTRFFIQGLDNAVKYVTRDVDGNNQFTTTTYNAFTTTGIGINATSLVNAGLGYVYSQGDICILLKQDDTSWQIPVIGQEGNYIILQAQDIGGLASAPKFIFEIYSPYKASEQEPYYEIGQIYTISNPKTNSRQYSITGNFLPADTYIFRRSFAGNSYNANAMSPNDLFYKRWDTDAGKLNFVTKIGQSVKGSSISWGDVYIPGTQVNGTSTFRLGGSATTPEDAGTISKLQLTSKIQNEGTVMLSICTNETNSMYLGETQITDSTGGTQFFSANSSVISTINTLKGSFGTVNPEAVVEFRGNVFYPDANRGIWVQYSANGLFPISSYKMTRFWKLFFKQYLSMTKNQIEALGGRPYIFTTVDASHMELLISIPKLLVNPPKGYLPDYPSEAYPFDIWDGKGKTVVFCLENIGVQPHWQGAYSFNPEQLLCIQNKLYSNKNGALWLHNQTSSYNNFYGTQYLSKIMIIANKLPQRPKVYNNISVESNMKPLFTYFYNDYPNLQTSDLDESDFRDLEGVFYATLYRNKIVPTNSGYTTDGLLTFEKLRNVAMKVMIEFNSTSVPLELKFVNIGYQVSRGHTT
jgi:hypothetical protein